MAAHDPHLPTDWDKDTAMALKAFREGVASEAQQKLAFNWIVLECAQAGGMSYRAGGPEGARATDFAEGKRFVGNQILKLSSDGILATLEKSETNRKSRGK